MLESIPNIQLRTRNEWREWLQKNHETLDSIWLVYEKGKNKPLSYDDIVEESLCFGWIDGVTKRVDEERTKIYISKRKPKGVWAKTNKVRVARLIQQGLMTTAGMKAIEIAKANGAWDQLNASDDLIKPPELVAKFMMNMPANDFYESLPNSAKRLILTWIYDAKTEATKIKRIDETVAKSASGIRAR